MHMSTDYVFDGRSSTPYTEESLTNPQSVYGASKLKGEETALNADPRTIIVRTSWVYSSYGKNFVKTMLRLMNEKDEISVVNDQYGSPTYAANLAAALIAMVGTCQKEGEKERGGMYHYSNEGVITWYEFAVAIRELAGLNCQIHAISTAEYPTAAKRPAYSVLDSAKIQKDFGIKLRYWKDSLRDCLERLAR